MNALTMWLIGVAVHVTVVSKMCDCSSIINLSQLSGKIESPGFPWSYDNNLNITWTMNASTPMRFLLRMVFFNIEDSEGCKNDRLVIKTHAGSLGGMVQDIVCGRMDSFPQAWYSVSYGVEINFKSDKSVTNYGFSMQYEIENVGNDEICNLLRKGNSSRGTIKSEYLGDGERYPANLNCSWKVMSIADRELHVLISKFNLELYGDSCGKDRLSVYTMNEEEENHLGTFCGRRDPWEVLVNSSNLVLLRLITDEGDNIGGFTVEYFSTPPRDEETISDSVRLRVKGTQLGTLDAPAAWASLLEQKAVFSWYLQADHGFTFTLRGWFRTHNTDEVFVTVYDAPTDSFDEDKKEYHLASGDSFSTQSTGFYLVVKAVFNVTSVEHLNMTYFTSNYFLSNNIHIRYLNKGGYTFDKMPNGTFKCCVYHQIVTLPNKTIAFNLRENGVFKTLPNNGNCSTAGVVVFEGGFDPYQTIGPVCDTIPNRVYETFKNFVSMSSTIFIFVYGYSITPVVMQYQYKLQAWSTACLAKHVTRASLSLPSFTSFMESTSLRSNLSSVSLETPDTRVQSQTIPTLLKLRVNSSYDPGNCFLVFIHSLENSEPSIEVTDVGQNITATLCAKWSRKTGPYKHSEEALPVEWSKYSQQWSCGVTESATNGTGNVYRIKANTNVTWSQRLVLFRRGDVGTYLCGEAPQCLDRSQPLMLLSPCGIIRHSGPECTWILQDSSDVRLHYWTIHILSMSPKHSENCSITTDELIRGGQTAMKTRFKCSDLVSNPQISYRTMELQSYLQLSNTQTSALKIRFTKIFVSAPLHGEKNSSRNNQSCPENSIYFEGFCYAFQREKGNLTWTLAEETCKTKNGHLVSITRQQELDFLKRLLGSHWSYDLFKPPFGYIFVGLSDADKPDVYWWQDGNPLSIADWYHLWDLNYNILPYRPSLPLNHLQSQPVADKNKRCVAMAVGNVHFSTNWAKISCLRPYVNPSYICKWPAFLENTTGTSKPSSHAEALTDGDPTLASSAISSLGYTNEGNELLACPNQWTYIQGQCYSLLSEDIPLNVHLPVWKATQLCGEIGGELAPTQDWYPETLLYYFNLWGVGQGDGNIWVRAKDELPGCTSVSTLLQGQMAFPSEKDDSSCVLDEGRAQFVLCQTNSHVLNTTCQEHQFTCQDRTCLPDVRVCDGHVDCLDGGDEELCHGRQDDLYFTCEDGSVISISVVCDFWPDCSDKSDETGCHHRACLPQEFSCRDRQCIPIEQRCDFVANCRDVSDEENCDWGVHKCKGFACPDGTCLPLSRVTDLVPDCPDGSEADEYSDDHLRLTFSEFSEENEIDHTNNKAWCPESLWHRRCHRERVTCFHRANMCIYDQNSNGDILHCRDGIHLKNCENYECPNHFKCPKSYCIPWYKVCDGKIDCIGGEDESKCNLTSCPGRLRCKDSQQCVPKEQVCDGVVHCIGSGTDEQFCDLLRWPCPPGCRCQGYIVDCNRGDFMGVPNNLLADTRVLDLDRNRVQLSNSSFFETPYLLVLRLTRNKITYAPIETFSTLLNLRILDLRFNAITSLYAHMFYDLVSLRSLLLQGNPLRIIPPQSFMGLHTLNLMNLSGLGINRIDSDSFVGLPSLEHLDLSNNQLSVLEPGFVPSSTHLFSMRLTGNGLNNTPAETFGKIVATKLWTDSFKFCCLVDPNSVEECFPQSDIVSSCEDLLSTLILRSFVWSLGVTCIMGNSIVLIWRIRSGCKDRPSVYVVHLATSDALMGVYLIILASADAYYRGEYILHDTEWRHGAGCTFLGVLTIVSSQMSMFTLLALAWDRYFAVMRPLSFQLRSTRHVWILCGGHWAVSLLIALLPVVLPGFEGFYDHNPLCLPFIFTDSKSAGWEYATAIFVGLNGLCIAVMMALYGAIYCRVRESQMDMGRNDRSDLVLAKRLSMVLLTNIISWIPLIMANVISLATVPLTRDMATMLTGVLLPLNPTINPYLYTFNSCVKRDPKKSKTQNTPKVETKT